MLVCAVNICFVFFSVGVGGLLVHLRAALHDDTAHSIHAAVTHIHTLVLDLNHSSLEVLLVEQHNLHQSQREHISASESR